MAATNERNQDATCYVGNLDEKASEGILWELFLQCGPVVNVYIPKDRVTSLHQGFGFVEFITEEDAEYATKVLNMVKLFNKPLRVNKASSDRHVFDVGANLFIGNLDPDVDEKMLYDTFSAFGTLTQTPSVGRDMDSGLSKGYGFVSYDSFEAADAAIESMNGQFMLNRPVAVSYSFKKDSKGERHGSAAERLLAAQNKKTAAVAAGVPLQAARQPAMQRPPPMQVPPMQMQQMGMAPQQPMMPGMLQMAPPAFAGMVPGSGMINTAGMMPFYGAGMPQNQFQQGGYQQQPPPTQR